MNTLETIMLPHVKGSDHRVTEVRSGQYLKGKIETFDARNHRAFGRSYGLRPMDCLGTFRTMREAVKAIESL